MKCCAVIPCYDNSPTLASVVEEANDHLDLVIVVDDGSTDGGPRGIAPSEGIRVITHDRNLGKGAAVKTGIKVARDLGYTHVLQIDADGQHDLDDIPRFLRAAEEQPDAIIAGVRANERDMPRASRFGRRFGLFWYRLETSNHPLGDTQCGFRVYPLSLFDLVLVRGDRMDFDVEVLVRAVWEGIPVIGIETTVEYFDEESRVSHFRPIKDNLLFTKMNMRLVCEAAARRLTGKARPKPHESRPSAWHDMKERGSRLGIRLTLWVLRLMGYRAARGLVRAISLYYYLTSPETRRWIRVFQSRAAGSASARTCALTLTNFALSILDRAFVFMGNAGRFNCAIEGREILSGSTENRKGAIFVGAHLGTLELAGALSGEEMGVEVAMLMYEDRSSKLYREFERLNPDLVKGMIRMSGDPSGVMIEIRRRQRRGELIGILADRPWKDASTVRLDFLGKPREFPLGPFRIAEVLRAPVLMAVLIKEGVYRYRLFIEEISPTGPDGRAGAQVLAARYASRLEEYARRFPGQWYNLYDFWDEGGPESGSGD